MTARRKLELVAPEPSEPRDIYGAWRAEIRRRDWAGVHIAADRREPVILADVARIRRL